MVRTIIGVLVAVLLVTLIIGLLASWPNWFNGTAPTEPWAFPGFFIGLLITVIVIGVLLRIVFTITYGPRHRHRRWEGPWYQDAEDILDQRYARGELTREQYQQMRDDLYKNRSGAGPYERPK